MSSLGPKQMAMTPGQRLCRSRYVIRERLIENPEGSEYWVAQDRDAGGEVVLYFLPSFLAQDADLTETFTQQVGQLGQGPWSGSCELLATYPQAKPRPLVAMKTRVGTSLRQQLDDCGPQPTWEGLKPLIESVFACLMRMHHRTQVHGKVSLDHIRFLPDGTAFMLAPGLDRLALACWHESAGEPIPESWDPNGSDACLNNARCQVADEVYSLALMLYEGLRELGLHTRLPHTVSRQGWSRLGNLMVPDSILEALHQATGKNPRERFSTLTRLAARMGMDIHLPPPEVRDGFNAYHPMEGRALFGAGWSLFLRPRVQGCLFGALVLGIALMSWLKPASKISPNKQGPKVERVGNQEPIPGDGETPQVVLGQSRLSLTSVPSEALVILESAETMQQWEDFSPVSWPELKEGAYRLRVRSMGYEATNFVTYLAKGQSKALHVNLELARVKVELDTFPSGGTYRYQDHTGKWHAGSVPAVVNLPLGDYLIHFTFQGETHTDRLELQKQEQEPLRHVSVFAASQLQVMTSPEGAAVYINEELMGHTPLVLEGLPHGPCKVKLVMPSHEIMHRLVDLIAGQSVTLRETLTPETLP